MRSTALACALGLAPHCGVRAQETNEVEQLKRQLQQVQENFERIQREQKQRIEALTQKLDNVVRQLAAEAEKKKLEQELITSLRTNRPAATVQADTTPVVGASKPQPEVAGEKKPWLPTDPIRIGGARAYMDIGLVGTFAAGGSTAADIEGGTQLGGHDPNQRGFTVQGVEANFAGAVDPYFRGNANLAFLLNSQGESSVELEEAWLETIALPWNLQVRAGQVLTEFGRINTQHPHSWAFVDTPLVNGRFFGPDGLRNPGARLSWLMPTPFYSELFLTVQNSQGETASSFRSGGHSHGGGEGAEELPFAYRHPDNDRGVKSLGDLLFTPRYAVSFDLTELQTLVLGASAAFGPNSSGGAGDTTTQIYGLDAYWKWKPANAHGGFPFVSLQAEVMFRRYEAGAFDWQEAADAGGTPIMNEDTGLPAVLGQETLTDYGFCAQLLYGFRTGWVAGLRGDFVTGDEAEYEKMALTLKGEPLGRDPQRAQRWRISPNLTWYPTEFSKLRLQYNYDDRQDIGIDHSVWLQFEFVLGAHAAHKF